MSSDLLFHYAENADGDSVLVVGTVEGQCPRDAVLAQMRLTPSYRAVVAAFASTTAWLGETHDPESGAETLLADEQMYDADMHLKDRALAAFLDWCTWNSVEGPGIAYYLIASR